MDSIYHLDAGVLRNILEQSEVDPLSEGARRRLEWLLFAAEHQTSIEGVSDHFEISPTTFRRWLKRFDPSQPSSLEEQSRRPHRVRQSDIEERVITLIERYRRQNPTMGPRKIRKQLKEEHEIILSLSTIWRIIDRHRLFFGDTLSHRAKRQEEQGESRDNPSNHTAQTSWTLLSVALLIGSIVLGIPSGKAQAEGTQTTDETTMQSTNFQFVSDEEAESVTLQGASSSSSSSSSSSQSSQSAQELRNGDGGGRGTAHVLSAGKNGRATKEAATNPKNGRATKEAATNPKNGRATKEAATNPKNGRATKEAATNPKNGRATKEISIPVEEENSRPSPRTIRLKATQQLPSPLRTTRVPHYQKISDTGRSLFADILGSAFMQQRDGSGGNGIIALLVTTGLGFAGGFMLGKIRPRCKKQSQGKGKRRVRNLRFLWMVVALTCGIFLFSPSVTFADQGSSSNKLQNAYHGRLLNSAGQAVTVPSNIRISLWKSADYVAGDVTSTGAINSASSLYGGWNEVKTVTPDSNGFFVTFIGTGTALPSLNHMSYTDIQSLYVQIEVKAVSSAQTSYELLDPNTSSSTIDRTSIFSFKFARSNGELTEDRFGSGSGSLARYESGGLLNTQQGLSFGGTIQKTLRYDPLFQRFNFNDDVRIQGDLTVTGLINGIDIDTLTGTLLTASGGGLRATVNKGSYRISGNVTNYAGSGAVGLSANKTNYVFFTSTGLLVNTIGFPTNHGYIPLAQITTSTGSVTSVMDRRVILSDDRERTLEQVEHAEFEHAVYQGDATNNVGQLYADHDSTNNRNFYRWTSSNNSLQDYDIILHSTLPTDFTHWNTGSGNAIRLTYRTTSSSANDNQLDISVFDTNGSPVTLSGSTTDLVNTSWTSTQIEFSGSPIWTPGGDFIIKFKMHARSDKQMHLGDIKFRYVELPAE